MPGFGQETRPVACRQPLQLSRLCRVLTLALFLLTLMLPGCRVLEWPWHRDEIYEPYTDLELKEYRDWATEVDFPDVATEPIPEAPLGEPRRLRNLSKDDLWDVTLEQAIHTALYHSDFIRSSGQFLSPGNPLLANPDFAPSAYDVAIQETGVLYGQRGVEAALSDFDAQFTTTMVWGRDERIQNNQFSLGVPPGTTLKQETANFNATLQKRLATGGVVGVTHAWDYEWNNISGQLYPSVYTGVLRTEFRQPLLAGGGTEYTRIAGPITENIQGVTGVQQGVVIARINADISIADFEQNVAALVHDVEELYWQLYLAYQRFDQETDLYYAALQAWRDVNARVEAQTTGGGAVEETESLDLVYQIEARMNVARNTLYDVEARLRRMMGLVPNDGRIIRPVDEPMIAAFSPDWYLMLSDALVRRADLRKQKWNIKRLEYELIAAKNLTKPRLDAVGGYRVNAFGDDLLGSKSDGRTKAGLGNAYDSLTSGDQTGWDLGLEFSVPIGFRFAHAQVSNIEFRLAKARAALRDQEIEVSHELAAAFRDLDNSFLSMRTGLNRKLIAQERLRTVEALHEATPDRVTQDSVIRAKDQAVQAESAFTQALVEYNVAVMNLYYRSGTLLGLNNVALSEGPWDEEAQFDAVEKAACRTRTIPTATMLHAEPAPYVIPGNATAPVILPPQAGPAYYEWNAEGPAAGSGQLPAPNERFLPPPTSPSLGDPLPAPPPADPPPYYEPPVDGPALPPGVMTLDSSGGASMKTAAPPRTAAAPRVSAISSPVRILDANYGPAVPETPQLREFREPVIPRIAPGEPSSASLEILPPQALGNDSDQVGRASLSEVP